MTDEQYSRFCRLNADKTKLYQDVIHELASLERVKIILAKDENDEARIEIGTNFLWKYIVQLVNDMVSLVWQKEWWEESEDCIRDNIGLSELNRYKKA